MEDCWMFFQHANRRWDCFNLVALLMDLDQTEQVPELLRHSFKLVLVEEQRVIFKHPESSSGPQRTATYYPLHLAAARMRLH